MPKKIKRKNMKILLIAYLYKGETSTALLVLKNLLELGHYVRVWDLGCNNEPPNEEFDISITWINIVLDLSKIKAKKKVLYYLEDSDYVGKYMGKEFTFESRLNNYDFGFTMNKIKGFEKHWLPMGCDEEIFKTIELPQDEKVMPKDFAIFLATCRDENRRQFAKELLLEIESRNLNLGFCGNLWKEFHNWTGKAIYLQELNILLHNFKIIINKHVGEVSPSDKVHCIIGAGYGLLINDNSEGYKECYPNAPVYNTIKECADLVEYYLKPENEEERIKLAKEMQKICHDNFTYKKQLKKMLEIIGG